MKRLILSLSAVLAFAFAKADEGMWMISNMSERTDSILRSLGLELTHDEIYSEDAPSLNSAIVMFGGFCSGVVVSPEGLVFTNHHCGFSAIQEHSTPKNDYLTNGFFAKKQKDELPNPGLYVAFHLHTVDVTEKVLGPVPSIASEMEREQIVDSICYELTKAVDDSVRNVYAEITPYYKGSKYYMSVYQRFDDVRLVFAPPQSLGKFGGDTDNWMWPRQTCDFSVFRIYANKDNQPAEYSKDNVPYKPIRYAKVSLQGYEPGSFCMTFGYPGSTDRYLSSYGTENTMNVTNALREQVRGVKLNILKEAMNASDAIRIMYAAKYAQSSNYWKFSIGQNKALKELGVIEEKKQLETDFAKWVRADYGSRSEYEGILDSLEVIYKRNFNAEYAMKLWEETFWSGSDVMGFVLKSMMRAMRDNSAGDGFKKDLEKTFKDIDVSLDKKVFAALLQNYIEHVPDTAYLPAFCKNINGDCATFVDALYARSLFSRPEELAQVKGMTDIVNDPMFEAAADLMSLLYNMRSESSAYSYERRLGEGVRRMNRDREYYPDANFTLRMSYGIVEGYSPTKDLSYIHYTLPQSLIDKNEKNPDNMDYELLPSVYKWLKKGKFGKQYMDKKSGDMQLCFLTNNDITGGNSGSGMFDGKGRLIGLAFDGNWDAMSGDLKFDDNLQRCIGVDIRYVLSVIGNYGKAKRLINELTLE